MKKNTYIGWLLLPALALSAPASYADQSFWQDTPAALKSGNAGATASFRHRRLQLDESLLTERISQTEYQKASSAISLSLPLPDGSFIAARLIPTALLDESVQEMYPDFRTWRIETDDKSIISGRAELTALGFHVMLRTRSGDQLFIEPEQRNTSPSERSYHSFSKKENTTPDMTQQRFSCGVLNTPEAEWQQSALNQAPQSYAKEVMQRAGEKLLTYRLAVAATGEYTAKAGGTKEAAASAIATTINRVNGIFERDLSISFSLVGGNKIIYSDAATDPYNPYANITQVYSTSLLLTQNQTNLDNTLGSQNYDIGHLLGVTSGGDGLAVLQSLCGSNVKAQGTTSSSSSLTSDAFIVDFVAHELGHQLGATHTFNATNSGSCSSGNRTSATAYEPGSGSTIMSYAGICGSNDFQSNADPHLHAKSIEQILNFTHNGSAASCAIGTGLSNTLPTVNAGADYTIPARTPFILQGSASDDNGDSLLYSWDQIDAGNSSALGVDTGNNALIKSSALAASPVRNVPDISELLSLSQTSSHGESLPRSDRSLNFRLSVRDGNGAVSYDDKKLTVKDTGERFEILSPGSNIAAGTQTITWNVAATDQAPISCSSVDIAYTNDQGATFTDLLTNTPNDGSASVQLTKTAQRIRVKCRDNIFFALSGTAPHIATYNGDSGQGSNVDGDNNNNSDDGGSGSIPAGLLAAISLLVFFRRQLIATQRNHS
jgi:hypothetical protein